MQTSISHFIIIKVSGTFSLGLPYYPYVEMFNGLGNTHRHCRLLNCYFRNEKEKTNFVCSLFLSCKIQSLWQKYFLSFDRLSSRWRELKLALGSGSGGETLFLQP